MSPADSRGRRGAFRFAWLVLMGSVLLVKAAARAHGGEEDPHLAMAREVLRQVPLVDGHNDLPWQYRLRADNHLDKIDLRSDTSTLEPPMHTDLSRLRAGGVGGQFWSIFVSGELPPAKAVLETLEQIDVAARFIAKYADTFELASSAADVRRIHGEGKIASLFGVEGGHSIGESLAVLRQLYRLGARYLTLTHSVNVGWADSATDAPEHGGLTAFGREVVREMNRLGMLIDLSHVSPQVMHQALDLSAAPVIFSHSSARALNGHARNVPDDVLARLGQNGGVVMVTFVPSFISEPVRQHRAAEDGEGARLASLHPGDPEKAAAELEAWRRANPAPIATLAQVADHLDHVRKVAGIDHVGLGSDFDGIDFGPVGLEGVDRFPHLLAELSRRGYSREDLGKIAGENLLRAFAEAETAAARLARETQPSDALIGELDSGE